MTDKEAMKQALEALEESGLRWPNIVEAITALRQAIAEAEKQEPVAHDPLPRACNLAGVDYQTFLKIKAYMPVYDTVPPQRTEPIQSLQCAHCQVTIETLNDKVMSLLAERTKQKPAAWIHIDPNKPKVKFLEWKENEHGYRGTWIKKPLYLHPPQRTWVGLTDEEIQAVLDKPEPFYDTMFWFARTIERKLKEKNT